jgi:hypothetical protein
MNSSRIALVAAVAAAASWTLKSVAIGTAGGLDKSPLEAPLFFAGLSCYVVASVALGVAIARRRPAWVRALAGVASVAVGISVVTLIGVVVNAVAAPSPVRHWAWAELNLWVIAAGALALSLAVGGRGGSRRPAAPRPA